MTTIKTQFTIDANVKVPLICGAMYPCSNPELVAAVSQAGGLGVIQPMTLTFVHKLDLRQGIRQIKQMTQNPVGFNAIIEKSSKRYETRMRQWIDIALEEGVRFFITALGNPLWVVEKVHAKGGKVYHDVTALKWAQKALKGGVDGLICVNSSAGGHAGEQTHRQLYEQLSKLLVPIVCAGGIGDENDFVAALEMGYSAVQMGTRFIATHQCRSHQDYKQAILDAKKEDIVLTDKISGVPVSIIKTPYIEKMGTKAGWLARKMLQHPKAKHYMRMFYTLRSVWQLKQASIKGMAYKDYFLAGKSVAGVGSIEPAQDIVRRFANAAADLKL